MSVERPLPARSDRRIDEHGRAICRQRRLPTQPEVAQQQAAVLQEWARRWRRRGPTDLFGQVELRLIGELAAELRRIAGAARTRQPSPGRDGDRDH